MPLSVLLVVIPQGSASAFAVVCPFGCCLFFWLLPVLLVVIPQGSAFVFAFAFWLSSFAEGRGSAAVF
jgi:hypothetical protein